MWRGSRAPQLTARLNGGDAVHSIVMKTLEVQVPDEIAAKVERAAERSGLSLEELVRVSLEEKLARDEAFDAAAKHVLAKNAELYERLS